MKGSISVQLRAGARVMGVLQRNYSRGLEVALADRMLRDIEVGAGMVGTSIAATALVSVLVSEGTSTKF